jgi:SAM-dependent methyltransferase
MNFPDGVSCPGCGGDRIEDVAPYRGVHEIFQRMRLGRCAGCGLVFAHPQPTAVELSAYYEHYWDGEVAVSTPSTRRYYFAQGISRLHYLRKFIDLGKRPRVLDMGAGLGLLRDSMARQGIAGEYAAVESDRVQFAALRERLGAGAAYPDLAALPAGRPFDLIVLAHVLEHAADPNGLVGALMARLRPGGALFVEVPNGDHRYKASFESHLLFFDEQSLSHLLRRHGELLDVASVGKPAAQLNITQVYPDRGALRSLKEAVKSLLAAITPGFDDRQIERYGMCAYGGDRQWLRALLRRA